MKLCYLADSYLGWQLQESHKLYSKNVSASHEKLPCQLLIQGTQVTPGKIKDTVVQDGCLPVVEGKSLLLKMQSISDRGLGEIELDLTQMPSPWRLDFIVPRDAM